MLIANWRSVLKRAWSVRLMLLAGLLSGAEIALPIIDQAVVIPRGIFAALSGLTTMAAMVARFIAQQSVEKPSEDQ